MSQGRPPAGSRGPYGRTVRPVGSEYVSKGGYAMVKVAMWPTVPGSKDNWRLKHKWVWERENGREVPEGWVVVFADGDRGNFDPRNLAAVPKGVLTRMNKLAGDDPALAWRDREGFDAVRLLAELDIAARRAEERRPRKCCVCGRRYRPDVKETKAGRVVKNPKTCRRCLDAGRHKGRSRK